MDGAATEHAAAGPVRLRWPKPPGSRWTDEQWRAIAAAGNNILVAAAAGSGKTAVLVERIIRTITDDVQPVDVDRLLVVTFTNAAAGEMRQRIGEALARELEKHPDSRHLRRQLSLLNRASISTMHSFCTSVVRQYYYRLNVDPHFRIADEVESELLQDEVLEALLEDEYGREDNGPFFDLVDRFGSDRSDVPVQQLIRKLYAFSRSHPFPEQWLDGLADMYHVPEGGRLDDLPWMPPLVEEVRLAAADAARTLQKALALAQRPGGPAAYVEPLQAELAALEHIAACRSWEALQEAFQALTFSRLPSVRKGTADEQVKAQVQQLRNDVKKRMDACRQQWFGTSPQERVEQLRALAPVVKTLVRLVREFGRRYDEAKKAKGLLDFNDLEHLCLRVLRREDAPPGSLAPSEAALAFREQFVEVLVDEYQDTNLVQEAILRLVSRGDNLFMVGDVKQSIYGFRLAEPGLFLAKYKAFTPDGSGEGLRIDLSRNFRSRVPVLAGTNFVFRQLMDEAVGELDYDDAAALKPGAVYPEAEDTAVELVVLDRQEGENAEEAAGGSEGGLETEGRPGRGNGGDGDPEAEGDADAWTETEELAAAQLEGRWLARQIRTLIEQSFPVYDRRLGAMRPVTYRDMVILLRTLAAAPVLLEELKAHGIPVYAELPGGYFEAVEVSTMLSLLKVIDNPDQDIPLAAVLRSPIVGLREDELAAIRLHAPKARFWEAVQEAARTLPESRVREKVRRFCQQLARWRDQARQGALSELIWQLYRETGYLDFVGGLPGGKQRQANLRALYDRARAYEATSFRGLFRFLRFVERMQDRGDDLGVARALGEQEDVVRLMTIHKSKGLEFPVVFVAGLGKPFNRQDLRENVLLHKDLGAGCRFIDAERRISLPSLPWLAVRHRLQRAQAAEEMRILYVAMTRAKEKLYLVGTVKDGKKAREKWAEVAQAAEDGWNLPALARLRAASFLDWLGPAVARHCQGGPLRNGVDGVNRVDEAGATGGSSIFGVPEGTRGFDTAVADDPSLWRVHLVPAAQLKETAALSEGQEAQLLAAVSAGRPVAVEAAEAAEVARRLDWRYPHEAATLVRSKWSVSEWKRRQEQVPDEAAAVPLIVSPQAFRRPRFVQQQRTLTPTEKGSAVHLVMQLLPLNRSWDEAALREELQRLVDGEWLSPEEAAAVSVEAILRFFDSPIGRRLSQAPWVRREVPFSLAVPAAEVQAWRASGTAVGESQFPANGVGRPDGRHGAVEWLSDGNGGAGERLVWEKAWASVPSSGGASREGSPGPGTAGSGEAPMADDVVLLQGVIDCLFRDEQGLVLLDYKTDTIYGPFADFAAAEPVLRQRYTVQLQLYARAVEAVWETPVDEKILYFFDGGHVLRIP